MEVVVQSLMSKEMKMAGEVMERCPVCQSKLKCIGKYQTVYVYQCTGAKCRRKWNADAIKARAHEKKQIKKGK